MLKPTRNTLKKIEYLFEQMGYEIRYAKGSFQSGYCVIHEQKTAVINKFFDTEGRISTLIDILSKLDVDMEQVDSSSQKIYQELAKHIELSSLQAS